MRKAIGLGSGHVLVCALCACGSDRLSATDRSDGGGPDASTAGAGGTPGGGAGSAGAPPVDDGLELPRLPADPKLTQRLIEGPVALVGGQSNSCTNAVPASGDRWCAFARRVSDSVTELWVLNVTAASRTGLVSCDGGSADCRLLSNNLWTDVQIWGPSHPEAHRFEGDTLIFHAGEAPGERDPYDGGIFAWRPGWAEPRKLTSDHGVVCFAQPRSTAIGCVSDAVIDEDPADLFDLPSYREFDLLAGFVDEPGGTPLRKAVRITHALDDLNWRVRFSRGGEHLLYSHVAELGAPESLYVLDVAAAGSAAPRLLATGVAEWELAHDGRSLYFLEGYDRSLGDEAVGTLARADFPSGAGRVALHEDVLFYELVGVPGSVVDDADRGVLLAYAVPGGPVRSALMADAAVPSALFEFELGVERIRIAPDMRHALYFKPIATNPVAVVARKDGSGACQLTQDDRAETYAARFSDSGRLVAWIEYWRNGSHSEEGWHARPEDCGARTKFGDYVLGYRLVAEDFVVFVGGDLADSTDWLQYTRLQASPNAGVRGPMVIQEHPDDVIDVVRDDAGTWILFTVSEGTAADQGLYIHGPLRQGE